jgi:predicted outer membrane repeat protein
LALAVLAALACPAIARGATRNVDAGNAACNDTTGAPFCKIQAAIDAASAGDRIEIAAGSYIEALRIDRNLTLAGAGISTVPGACDGQTNLLGGPAISVLTGITVTLTNVTVKGGTASFGGGISNAGVLFVSDSEVCENSTFNQGGGICTTGVLGLSHVQVYRNKQASAGAEGGGLFVQSRGWAIVTNSSFDHNRTTQGGAIYVAPRGTLLIRNSTLEHNFADATVASALSGQGYTKLRSRHRR